MIPEDIARYNTHKILIGALSPPDPDHRAGNNNNDNSNENNNTYT